MSRSSRKEEHIHLALRLDQSGEQGLDDVKFVHNCLPEIVLEDIKLITTIGGLPLSSPIIVNAMTGGAKETVEINRALAEISRESNLALAVGSQMAAIKDPELEESYRIVRKTNPKGMIFANLGSEATPDMAKKAVDMIEANGLQIHLNVVQELVMPEGDRNFTGVLNRIENIVRSLDVPIIVKEVGFGMAQEGVRKLSEIGVQVVDVGGRGGTNFASIENERRLSPHASFNDWGLSTAASLLETSFFQNCVDVVASGGIRTPLDIARSLALGARAAGLASPFLSFAVAGKIEEGVAFVRELHVEIRKIMAALGVTLLQDLSKVPLVITGDTYHWATMRGIHCPSFALRKF